MSEQEKEIEEVQEDAIQEAQLETEQPVDEQPLTLPGAELLARREELGWTVEEAASRLKMTSRQIQALEANDFSALPGAAITRGFIRAYGKAMQMDVEPLVAALQQDEPESKKKKILRSSKPAKSTVYFDSRMPTLGNKNLASRKWLIGVLLVSVLIAALLLGRRMGWIPDLSKLSMLKKEVPAEVASEAKQDKTDVAAKPSESDEQKKPAPDAQEQNAQEPDAAKEKKPQPAPGLVREELPPVKPVQVLPAIDESTMKQVKKETKATPSKNVLVLSCHEQTWYEFRRPDGLVLKSGLLQAGTSKSFTVDQPMQLTLGNGPAVEATLGGKPLEINPRKGRKIVRLNLK